MVELISHKIYKYLFIRRIYLLLYDHILYYLKRLAFRQHSVW